MLKTTYKAFAFLGASAITCTVQSEQTSSHSPLSPGYSASTSYLPEDKWGAFFTAGYIYWDWQQDSLKMGSWVDPATGSASGIFQSPGYSSGFQVGLGINLAGMDDWNLYSEYTWYKNSVTTSLVSSPDHLFEKQGRGSPFYLDASASSELKIKLDALDLLLQRPFYFGKKLVANFSAGLSALWISQNVNKSADGLRKNLLNSAPYPFESSFSQHLTSWGLGPKFQLETMWRLGLGLQILANLSTSILYTRYNLDGSLSITNTIDSVTTTRTPSIDGLDNYNVLRPITQAFLGLGWDKNLCQDRYHIGLSAGYDFNVYWNYDMLNYAAFKEKSDLYLQGLNVQFLFGF